MTDTDDIQKYYDALDDYYSFIPFISDKTFDISRSRKAIEDARKKLDTLSNILDQLEAEHIRSCKKNER